MRMPVVFNIQRMSIHDGPGVRSTVFFKGCSLRCQWCHNPESILNTPELEVKRELCTRCGKCVKACGSDACSLTPGIMVDRKKCTHEFSCVDACNFNAMERVGILYSVPDIMEEVLKDRKMYGISGGGVTLSGGEPLLQAEAAGELLSVLHSEKIHTAVDTAGHIQWKAFEMVLPYTDLFLYDLKTWEEEVHKRYTGSSNRRILKNFERLDRCADIWVRIPVIEGVNTEQLPYLADFLKDRDHVKKIELLPYHSLGKTKYENMGYRFLEFATPSGEHMMRYKELFEKTGCEVTVAG